MTEQTVEKLAKCLVAQEYLEAHIKEALGTLVKMGFAPSVSALKDRVREIVVTPSYYMQAHPVLREMAMLAATCGVLMSHEDILRGCPVDMERPLKWWAGL